MHAPEQPWWWIDAGSRSGVPDREGSSAERARDTLADLLATLAEGRRAREAAERRMAEEPAEALEDILGASARPQVAVFVRSSGRVA